MSFPGRGALGESVGDIITNGVLDRDAYSELFLSLTGYLPVLFFGIIINLR